MKKGLLIVGHGSRSNEAQKTFEEVVELVRNRVDKEKYTVVEGAHMEICKPNIPEVVEKIVERNVEEIMVVPYFLYKGMHIKKDIPKTIEKLSEQYKRVNFKLGRPIGVEPLLADILISRADEISS